MAELPSGTVTFLFSDVEGSTRLWQQHPEGMKTAMARHDEVLREAVEAHGGIVVKSTGDGVYAAFASAPAAVSAAVDAQLALASTAWPETGELRVRIGLHSGEAQVRDGDYFGLVLNRAARLMGTAHGGQVVVSLATEELARDALAAGVSLRDLGEHRLRDLAGAERVFQVVAAGLRPAFPPLRSLQARSTNLPVQLTSFFGREDDLKALVDVLGENRMVSLVGPGGCGKTRLAVQAAADVLERFDDGVWFVDLSGLRDPGLLAQAVATTLDLSEEPGRSLTETLSSYLVSRETLLVLDNCEHLVEASAELTDGLLRSCSALRIMTTTREPLGVAGEVTWRVPSLAVPERDATVSADLVLDYGAVQLFVDRAERARPAFRVTDDIASVAEICRRLDGIPLAIELAAARVRMLSVEAIAAGLTDRLRLLGGGPRTAVPRHQTIAASIDWSHDLLSDAERVLFRRVSVFAGGFDLDAAEHVCSGDPLAPDDVFDLLGGLVDRSLVMMDDAAGSPRFRLLETIRQYGAEQLADAREAPDLRTAHLDYYASFAERVAPKLEGGEQQAWMDRLEVEHNNLRAALDWSMTDDQIEIGLRLASALHYFWYVRGHYSDGASWFERLLSTEAQVSSRVRASALYSGSYLTGWGLGRLDAITPDLEECLGLAREAGDARAAARALFAQGMVLTTYDPTRALTTFEEAIEFARTAGDTWCLSYSLCHLGWCRHLTLGHGAFPCFDEALAIARERDHVETLTETLGMSANAALFVGEYSTAEAMLKECLAVARELDHQLWIPGALVGLGDLARRRGRYDEAERLIDDGARIAEENGMPLARLMAAWLCGECALAAGRPERALEHLEESVTACRIFQLPVFLAHHLGSLAAARIVLGDRAGARAAFDEGLQLATDLTLPLALAVLVGLQGRLALLEGDLDDARATLLDALRRFRDLGDPQGQADTLDDLACLAADRDDLEQAAHIVGLAQAVRDRIGYARPVHSQQSHAALVERLRGQLGTGAFEAALTSGTQATIEDVIAER